MTRSVAAAIRHVGDVGGIPAAAGEARMRRDPPAGHEDFDVVDVTRVDARVDELIRHAVAVALDLHVIIDVHATRRPRRQRVPAGRQRSPVRDSQPRNQGRTVNP